MKAATLIGIILLVLGLISFIAGGISYKTDEKVIDAGPLQVNSETTKHLPIHPIFGGLLVAGGIILLFAGNRRV
jgi:predicted membrane channel-forming protein YqfA (hemolysin III family)